MPPNDDNRPQWAAVAVDFHESPMFEDLPPSTCVRYAWSALIAYVKCHGRRGVVRHFRVSRFAAAHDLDVPTANEMLRRALNDGAIVHESGQLRLVNWYTYQRDQRRPRQSKSATHVERAAAPPVDVLDVLDGAPTSSERFEHQSLVQRIFERLPEHRRKSIAKFRDAVIVAMRNGTVTEQQIGDALAAYYTSEEGRSKFARAAHTLVVDEVWHESPEAWSGERADTRSLVEQQSAQYEAQRNGATS